MGKQDKYTIYCHITNIGGQVYFGITKDVERRWGVNGCNYRNQPKMWEAIQKYGWDNITHFIMAENVEKEVAIRTEGLFIDLARMNGMDVLNGQRSGGSWTDEDYVKEYFKDYREQHIDELNAYQKEYYQLHSEEINSRHKERYQLHRNDVDYKIYNRVASYNQRHIPIETPLEAKTKYLQYGYIPSYIKNDDLI